MKDADVTPTQDVKSEKTKLMKIEPIDAVVSSVQKDVETEVTKDVEPMTRINEESKVIESRMSTDDEEQRLFRDVEEMKSKLHELESKLSKVSQYIDR